MIALFKTANLSALCDICLLSFFKALVSHIFFMCYFYWIIIYRVLKMYMHTGWNLKVTRHSQEKSLCSTSDCQLTSSLPWRKILLPWHSFSDINCSQTSIYVHECTRAHTHTHTHMGFPDGSVVKNLSANARDAEDTGSFPGSGRSPGVVNGNLFQCSCLENYRRT